MDMATTGHGIYEAGYFAILGIDVKNWELLTSNLLEKVALFKSEIRKICAGSLDCSLQSKLSSNTDGILEFIESIVMNLKDLVGSKGDRVNHVKKQIQVLEGKLRFSKNFLDFASKYCNGHDKLEEFQIKVQSWANNAAFLTLLYWVDGSDVAVDVLRKIMSCTPEFAEMYLELMKCSKSSQSDTLLMNKIFVGFVDFLLENPMDALEDHVEILREGLMFCLSFLMDPPMDSTKGVGNVLLGEINETISGLTRLVCSLNIYDKQDEGNLLLDFLQKINNVQAEVRELYVQQLNSSESRFPSIVGKGFIVNLLDDFEMMKCEGKFSPFARHKVGIIHEELMSWRPFLKDIVEQQNQHQELKDLWRQILNVAYRAERVISSCLSADCHIWFDMVRLANVLEEIKLISFEVVRKARSKLIENMGQPSTQMSSTWNQPSEVNTSKADEIVGLKDEADAIIHQLKAGTDRLHIVSIVGMPGVDKTTLAKKIYNDLSVQFHFSRHAWCFVPKVYGCRDLLLGILRSVTAMTDAQISSMKDNDLADELRKSLKGGKVPDCYG